MLMQARDIVATTSDLLRSYRLAGKVAINVQFQIRYIPIGEASRNLIIVRETMIDLDQTGVIEIARSDVCDGVVRPDPPGRPDPN